MIDKFFFHPLGPSLILAIGGVITMLWPRWARHAESWYLRIGLLTTLVAGIHLWSLRGRSVPDLGWAWRPLTLLGGSVAWGFDRWNWFCALLVLGLLAVALLLQELPQDELPRVPAVARSLFLAAGVMSFVFSENALTIVVCWVLLDLLLLFRLGAGVAQEPSGRMWSFVTFGGLAALGAVTALGPAHLQFPLTSGSFGSVELGLLWLAALVRTGAYPVHFWLTGEGRLSASERILFHLMAPTAGIWMLARVHQAAGGGWLHGPLWTALGILALLGTALAAWTCEDHEWSWRWIAINRASMVVMVAYLASLAGPAVLLWPLVSFVFGMALLEVGQSVRLRWGWNLPIWMAAIALWGAPLTPGFLARSALFQGGAAGMGVPGFLLIAVSETLLVAALWRTVRGHGDGSPAPVEGNISHPLWRFAAATIVLAAPLLAWGVAPARLAALAGLTGGELTSPSLAGVIASARPAVWLGLMMSGAAGVLLGHFNRQVFGGMRGWQEGIHRVVSLEWVVSAGELAGGLAGGALQYFARLGEGEGYVGWLALGGLLLWVLLRV
jgi:hypothetical protein